MTSNQAHSSPNSVCVSRIDSSTMEAPPPPHVLLIPFPAQGHVKPMFMIAHLLAQADFRVTFINTQHNHARFLAQIDPSFHTRFPKFQFHTIPDGLPADHPRSGIAVAELLHSTSASCKPHFKELVTKISTGEDGEWDPPTCIISDGVMSFDAEVGEELGIPVFTYRSCSATCAWIYLHLQKLIQAGEIPVNENNEDADRAITCIPGLETIMRRRDLPTMCRVEADHLYMRYYLKSASKLRCATALILITCEELEGPIVSHLRSILPNVYTIGPVEDLVNSRADGNSSPFIGSLSQPDQTCIAWLDSQPPKSVVYVSFGSVIELSKDELMEFWHGLVDSEKPFLWVMRFDMMGTVPLPPEVMKGTSDRGFIAEWVAQEEVLAHGAVGVFLTHAGWNSTMEGIAAGVPLICWPKLADQPVNSRCISNVWNNGLDMKDICDGRTIEKMVRDLMEGKREDIVMAAVELRSKVKESVSPGGSSHKNRDKLIQDIITMNNSSKGA